MKWEIKAVLGELTIHVSDGPPDLIDRLLCVLEAEKEEPSGDALDRLVDQFPAPQEWYDEWLEYREKPNAHHPFE